MDAGERILEYRGLVTTWREAADSCSSRDDEGHTFLFGLSDGRVIDGGRGGNSTRWLNHACDANCQAVEEAGRVFIEATRAIEPGEELLIDYCLEATLQSQGARSLPVFLRCWILSRHDVMQQLTRLLLGIKAGMEQLFMTRRRAIARLLQTQGSLRDEISGFKVGKVEQRFERVGGLERLILDVRASRIHHFQLAGPPAVEIFITD